MPIDQLFPVQHLAGGMVVVHPFMLWRVEIEAIGHRADVLVEMIPAGVALVVVHVAFPVEHLPRGQVIVDPFAAIGGNVRYALRHRTSGGVEIVPGTIAVILALDHMTGSIIANPFTTIGLKIYVLVTGYGTIRIYPIPILIFSIVYFFGTDLLTIFVIMFLLRIPTIGRMSVGISFGERI